MKQQDKKIENLSKQEINRLVTRQFLEAVQQIAGTRILESVNSEKEFADLITTDQSKISKLKTDDNRYVTLDILCKAVNVLGMDANNFFVVDNTNTTKKKLIREGVTINSTVSGNNNHVTNGKNNTVINGNNHGNVYTAEKIIQGMPEKEKKEMKKYMDNFTNEILDLKKTIAHYKKELKIKDKKLMDTQEKYIKMMESQQNQKK